ncbi:hypothetical protein SLA2020_212110 [Shorea laevis]
MCAFIFTIFGFGESLEMEVRIFNILGVGVELTLQCRSAGVNLGQHNISTQEQYYFTVVPGTPVYSCSFVWPGNAHSFDIYVEKRDYENCKEYCFWEIKPNGPCFTSTKQCYPWR